MKNKKEPPPPKEASERVGKEDTHTYMDFPRIPIHCSTHSWHGVKSFLFFVVVEILRIDQDPRATEDIVIFIVSDTSRNTNHHLSLNRDGRWSTTDDFTSFLHFPLFSTALWDLANSKPVHFPDVVFPTLPPVCLGTVKGVEGENKADRGTQIITVCITSKSSEYPVCSHKNVH